MSIDYYFEETDKIDISGSIGEWLQRVIQREKKEAGEISFIFCSDDYLLEMNRKYLNHDYYTDVITFDYTEEDMISGDIFISVDTVADNAKSYKVEFKDELYRVMVHGVLHLIGYKDKAEKDKILMTAKEDEYLTAL